MMAMSFPCAAPVNNESDEAGFVTRTYETFGSPLPSASFLQAVNMLPTAMAMNSIAMNVFIVLIIELIFL
jgi:hypothetical protein